MEPGRARDDGTFAALITALRLTGGSGSPRWRMGSRRRAARWAGLGRRDLARAGRRHRTGEFSGRAGRAGLAPAELPPPSDSLDSGFVFQVDPGRGPAGEGKSRSLRPSDRALPRPGLPAALGSMGLSEDRLAGDQPPDRTRTSVQSLGKLPPRSTGVVEVGPRRRGRGSRHDRPRPRTSLLG